jgi:L-lactate dehydrogenase complex protein LldG
MGSREEILAALRASAQVAAQGQPLPELPTTGIRFADPVARFLAAVAEVGGSGVRVARAEDVEGALLALPQYREARRVAACVPGVSRANVDLAAVTDPHQLADVDFAVLPGELGVAESGAVWVLEARIHPRAVAFLAQHIAIVLPAAAIVEELHQAYARIQVGERGFSMWLSGPSKTADIEQALVIGAHGPRSCHAIVVG